MTPKTEDQQKLLDYIDTYSKLFDITDNGSISSRGVDYNVRNLVIKADVEIADEIMHQFAEDLEKFGKDNNIDVSNLLEGISGQLKKTWTDELKEYKTIYDEFMKAEVVRNDTLRPLYQQSIQAVEDYNNALSSGEGVEEAKANLDAVQQSVQNATGELEGSQEVFDGIYEGINKNAEAAYQMSQAFESDESVKGYAEQLKGLTDIDLQAINFEDNVQSPGEEAFKALIEILGLSEDEVQNLIDKLVELGYVQGKIQSDVKNQPASFSDIFSLKSTDDTVTNLGKISESIDAIQNAYKTLYDAIDEYNEEGSFSIDTLQSVIALGDDWLDYLVDEDGALKLDKESLEQLTQSRLNDMRVQAINNVIDNVSKIQDDASANEYLKTTNYALAESYEEVAEKALESARAQMQAAVSAGTLSQANLDAAMNKATADISKINKLFASTDVSGKSIKGGSGGSGGSKDKNTSSDFSETVNFFERRVEVLNDAVNLLKTNLENVNGSFAKNQLLDQSSNILEERMRNYSDAARMYQQKAQESLSKLDLETQKKIIDGSVSITDYIGESNKAVVEAMNDYKAWSDKVADCTEELASLKEELRQLELDKFNHIVQDFTDQFDLRDNAKNLIDKQIALFKEAGQQIGKAFYEEQIQQSQKQLTLLENEKAQLVNQMTSAIGSGRIQKGTDEWLEMVGALSSVDGNILDCKKSIEEFDNAIQNLHWETFDRVQDSFKNVSDEISNLIGVIDDSDVATKDNQWTKEGLTQLGLYAQQYELATYQVSQYADEIDKLNADYLHGKYSATEYTDKLADLNSAQWDAVNAAQSAKDSILKLNESRVNIVVTGIQEEIDAYKELMDSQVKALDAEKDLHEYQSSIAEQSKTIAKLEKQLAAMQNDTTASTVAKRKQLEEQLTEARASLDETQYNHSVETQKEALNQQYQDYEDARNREIEALEETLTDRENMIASSMESVKQNTQLVADQLTEIANQHGITISNALILSWKSGENAIASYGEVLTQGTSVFIENIIGMENQLYQLQADADITALSLASMFGTSADNLVNELNTSYFAEANLLNMTNALQSSLINTLQGGYDVSSIVNSLDNITKAAERTKKTIGEIPMIPEVPSTPTSPGKSSAIAAGKIGTGILGKEHMAKYASGARNITADQLAITNESGQELIYHAADGSILTPLRNGDKVFDNTAVERLWKIGQGILPVDITPVVKLPDLNTIKKSEGTVNMKYDHLIEINGDVNDTDHFIKQISTVAQQAIVNAVKTAEKTRKYGMF